jgi:hypothetical protein
LEEANLPRNGAYPLEVVNVGIQHYVDKIALAQIKNAFLCHELRALTFHTLDKYTYADIVYNQLILTPLAMLWLNRKCMEGVVEELNVIMPTDVEEVREEDVEVEG